MTKSMKFNGRRSNSSAAVAQIIEDEIIFDQILIVDDGDNNNNNDNRNQNNNKNKSTNTYKNGNAGIMREDDYIGRPRPQYECNDFNTVSDIESIHDDILEIEKEYDDDDDDAAILRSVCRDNDPESLNQIVQLHHSMKEMSKNKININITSNKNNSNVTTDSSITNFGTKSFSKISKSKSTSLSNKISASIKRIPKLSSSSSNKKTKERCEYICDFDDDDDRWMYPAITEEDDDNNNDDNTNNNNNNYTDIEKIDTSSTCTTLVVSNTDNNNNNNKKVSYHHDCHHNENNDNDNDNIENGNNNQPGGIFKTGKKFDSKRFRARAVPSLSTGTNKESESSNGYFELRRQYYIRIRIVVAAVLIGIIVSLSVVLSQYSKRQTIPKSDGIIIHTVIEKTEEDTSKVKPLLPPQFNGTNVTNDKTTTNTEPTKPTIHYDSTNPLMNIHHNTSLSSSSSSSSSSSNKKNETIKTDPTTTNKDNQKPAKTSTEEELVDALVDNRPSTNHKPIYINPAGKKPYLDSRGNTWVTDTVYSQGKGGTSRRCSLQTNISLLYNQLSADDKDLFNLLCSERWFDFDRDDELSAISIGDTTGGEYEIPVVHGVYKIILHFAEFGINNTISTVDIGERVFDVFVEGSLVHKNLDIIQDSYNNDYSTVLPEVLNASAIKISAVAVVLDGYLTIAFNPIVGQPKINAIEIHPIDAGLINFPH